MICRYYPADHHCLRGQAQLGGHHQLDSQAQMGSQARLRGQARDRAWHRYPCAGTRAAPGARTGAGRVAGRAAGPGAGPSTVPTGPGLITVMLTGELDAAAIPDLADRLAQALARDPGQLVVDLAQVSFIDCAAARLLTSVADFLPPGRKPTLRHPGPAVCRVLDLTGLGASCAIEA